MGWLWKQDYLNLADAEYIGSILVIVYVGIDILAIIVYCVIVHA